jgi:dsDNA-specific endonuclease/ATPase MutS2
VVVPAYFFVTNAKVMTFHSTHYRELARKNADNPRVEIASMGIRHGIPTRQIVKGIIADSNALQVAESEGMTMEAALARLRQLGIEPFSEINNA